VGHLVPDGVKQEAQGDVKTVVPAALPDPLLAREKSVTDKLNSLVIDIVVGGLSQFGQHVYDKQFDLVRLKKRKKDWTDNGDH
jgi:hypothetical protein